MVKFQLHSNSVFFVGKSKQSSSSLENQHSYLWYQNASDSDKKPLAQTTTLKTGSKAESTYDSWDSIMGLHPPSHTQEPRRPASSLAWGSSDLDLVQTRLEKPRSPPRLHDSRDDALMMESDLIETTSFSQTSTSLSHDRNSNCRTYRRPNKQGSGKTSDSNSFASIAFGTDLSKSTTDTNVTKTTVGGGSRGRTRDYTVLQPSSMSMFNVTIQGRAAEEFGSETAPTSGAGGTASGSTTQLGDLGWQRKKTEAQNTR